MKNKTVVSIELGGKERHLHYNLNSLEIVEDITGLAINEAMQNVNMKVLKALVYAGLKWEDKSLTLEEVGEIISFEDIEAVSTAISKCFEGLK